MISNGLCFFFSFHFHCSNGSHRGSDLSDLSDFDIEELIKMHKLCRQVSIESPGPVAKDCVFSFVVPVPDTPEYGARVKVISYLNWLFFFNTIWFTNKQTKSTIGRERNRAQIHQRNLPKDIRRNEQQLECLSKTASQNTDLVYRLRSGGRELDGFVYFVASVCIEFWRTQCARHCTHRARFVCMISTTHIQFYCVFAFMREHCLGNDSLSEREKNAYTRDSGQRI